MAKGLKINHRDNCAVLLADAKAGETVEVQTDTGIVRLDARHDIALGHKITPTLILPHQGGGEFFRELDAPQLCCGVLH